MAAVIKDERDRFPGMGPDGQRGGMVGKDQDAVRTEFCKAGQDRSYHFTVEELDGPDLLGRTPLMSGLVRGFHMDIGQIVPFFKGGQGRLGFTAKIAVQISGGPRYPDDRESGQAAETVNKVDGRNDDSPSPETFRDGG